MKGTASHLLEFLGDTGTGSCHEIAIDMLLGDVGDASLAKNFTSFPYYNKM